MVPEDTADHSRIFLHPTENQLWANAIGEQHPVFPKYSVAMIAICDQSKYETLVETLSQMLKNKTHLKENVDGCHPCLANFLCLASLGICFCPFLYWNCKKNKESCDSDEFETNISTLVTKHTSDWPGKVTIRRDNQQSTGELLVMHDES